ncbi:MAG: translation initiation factor IF-2 N-terminal domain-containing protein [Gemmatimonadetes bacterium]|nr:translation initiation factor IF-2 N-terminal domain-containing protein [Gemmatimonadota bacterium]
MVKSRVHDLAAEFGVPVEQVMGMLREMNIFVRSHLSALEPDQVAAARVRWEREKRKAAEAPAPKKGRRKVAEAAPAPTPADAKPVRRRRTAAEVAEAEAKAAEEAEEVAARGGLLDLEPLVLEVPVAEAKPVLSLEERAKLLFKDLPPAPPEPEPTVVEPPAAESAESGSVDGGRRCRTSDRTGGRPRAPAAAADAAAPAAVTSDHPTACRQRHLGGWSGQAVHSAARAAPGARHQSLLRRAERSWWPSAPGLFVQQSVAGPWRLWGRWWQWRDPDAGGQRRFDRAAHLRA